MRHLTSSILLLMVLAGCTGQGIEVSDARIGEPTGPNAALYFTASGPEDMLVGASTDVASRIELHETIMSDEGTMLMSPVESLALGPDDPLVLEPGGYHLMLVDADRLEIGDQIEVVLTWVTAGEMTITADVVAPNETTADQ